MIMNKLSRSLISHRYARPDGTPQKAHLDTTYKEELQKHADRNAKFFSDRILKRLENAVGATPLLFIATSVGLDQDTAYGLLEKLEDQGTVVRVPKSGGPYYKIP